MCINNSATFVGFGLAPLQHTHVYKQNLALRNFKAMQGTPVPYINTYAHIHMHSYLHAEKLLPHENSITAPFYYSLQLLCTHTSPPHWMPQHAIVVRRFARVFLQWTCTHQHTEIYMHFNTAHKVTMWHTPCCTLAALAAHWQHISAHLPSHVTALINCLLLCQVAALALHEASPQLMLPQHMELWVSSYTSFAQIPLEATARFYASDMELTLQCWSSCCRRCSLLLLKISALCQNISTFSPLSRICTFNEAWRLRS